jgi:hypothetical protein
MLRTSILRLSYKPKGSKLDAKLKPSPTNLALKTNLKLSSHPKPSVSTNIKKLPLRVLWFSDPYLLAEYIKTTLLTKSAENDVIELVKRHQGAANAHVYGVLFKCLAQLGSHQKMVDVWRNADGKKNHMKYLSPMGYTVLFSSLLNIVKASPKGDLAVRTGIFKTSLDVWNQMYRIRENNPRESQENEVDKEVRKILEDEIEYKSANDSKEAALMKEEKAALERKKLSSKNEFRWDIIKGLQLHSNAMLNICVETARVGGFELGSQIFKDLKEPDVISYTTMFRICASKGSDAYETGMSIWNEMPKHLVDARNFASFILFCSRADTTEKAEAALGPIHEYLGLPKTHDGPESAFKVTVTTASLTSLLHLCIKIKFASLGTRWFEICSKNRDVCIDEGVTQAYISLLVISGNFKEAFNRSQKLGLKKFEYGFRICAEACKDNPSFWLLQSDSLLGHSSKSIKLTPRDLTNYLIVCNESKNWKKSLEFIQTHSKSLITLTKDKAEEILKSKKNYQLTSIKLHMEGLNLVLKVMKVISKDKDFDEDMDFHLTWRHAKEAQNMVDLLLRVSKKYTADDVIIDNESNPNPKPTSSSRVKKRKEVPDPDGYIGLI